jgi:hypothetical protein
MSEFKIGDRVRVKPERCDGYVQPWRNRFKAGRMGTIMQIPSQTVYRYAVQWDCKHAKYVWEWNIYHPACDLELVPDAH